MIVYRQPPTKQKYKHTKIKIQNKIKKTITGDGYILELHRIPPRHNGSPAWNGTAGRIHDYETTEGKGRPVFLQHGVFSSSACWLLNPSHRSLGMDAILCFSVTNVNLIQSNSNLFLFVYFSTFLLWTKHE